MYMTIRNRDMQSVYIEEDILEDIKELRNIIKNHQYITLKRNKNILMLTFNCDVSMFDSSKYLELITEIQTTCMYRSIEHSFSYEYDRSILKIDLCESYTRFEEHRSLSPYEFSFIMDILKARL